MTTSMSLQCLRLLVPVIPFFLFSPLTHAQSGYDLFTRWADSGGNAAAGAGLSMDVSDHVQASVGPSVSAEYAHVRDYLFSYLILDARVFASFAGGTRMPGLDRDATQFFSLRLIGSVSGGWQIFKVLPVNLALEDLNLNINRASGVRAQALIGSTLYLPIREFERTNGGTVFYLAATLGSRQNTDASHGTLGVQPKVRLLTENYSVELRGVFGLSSDVQEETGVIQFTRNNLFLNRDQLGVYLRYTHLTDPNPDYSGDRGEGFLFYGYQF